MWPATYSARLRVSSRMALPSARMRRTSAVLTSAVFWFGSPIVACKMVCAGASLPMSRAAMATAKPNARACTNGVIASSRVAGSLRLAVRAGKTVCPGPAKFLLVGQPDTRIATEALAVVIGLEAGGMDAMGGEFLVAILGVAGDPDRADDIALLVANLQAPALGKDLIAAGADQVAHEDRFLLGAHFHELGGAPHRQR